MSSIITLMTDFGLQDSYVAAMKGAILRIAPQVSLIDITHLIQPQDIRHGAIALGSSAVYFPDGTIHLCVVDPGVGTARRPMAARFGPQGYVGPDNGLITALHAWSQQHGWPMAFYHLDKPEYWLKDISNVFHGRDIFSPVAAHLARGLPFDAVGSRFHDPVLLPMPPAERTSNGVRGQITHFDHFGNIGTNIRDAELETLGPVRVRLRGNTIDGLVRTFGERPPGQLVALIDSSRTLSVAVTNGSAQERLGAQIGDPVEVEPAQGL